MRSTLPRTGRLLAGMPLLASLMMWSPADLKAQSQDNSGGARPVGNAVIGGKRVELLSDKTWRYAEAGNAEAGCVPINAVLQFCGSILDWKPNRTTGTDFIRMFRHDDRNYAGIIYEKLGRRDGLSNEAYRSVILEGAAMATDVRASEIPVLDVRRAVVDEISAETMIYGALISDIGFVFMNSFIVLEEHSFQFLSWSVSKDLSEEHEDLHANFLNSIKLDIKDEDL